VQTAVKQALEALHELGDCASRGEWTRDGWSTTDEDLWHAHMGARNAAHHTSSAPVALHSDQPRVTWDLDPQAVAELRSDRQRAAYNERLGGEAALPGLQRLADLVAAAVPA
jgi:hypothetical protein